MKIADCIGLTNSQKLDAKLKKRIKHVLKALKADMVCFFLDLYYMGYRPGHG